VYIIHVHRDIANKTFSV